MADCTIRVYLIEWLKCMYAKHCYKHNAVIATFYLFLDQNSEKIGKKMLSQHSAMLPWHNSFNNELAVTYIRS